jgi:hypothetical protein
VRVEFTHGARDLGGFSLDAVPRSGEVVALPGPAGHEQLIVWNVTWCLDAAEPFAQVQLMTRQGRDRAISRQVTTGER